MAVVTGGSVGSRHAGITADQVVGAALELIRTGGEEALTMRRLAAKLGVAATAIYWHVGDKETLLDAVVDRVSAQIGEVPVQGDDPVARIVSVGIGLQRNLLAEPNLVILVHRRGKTTAMFQPARRALVRELMDAGLGVDDVALGLRVVLAQVSGAVMNELQMTREPNALETPDRQSIPDDVPDAAALLEAMARPVDRSAIYRCSLALLVRAVIERGNLSGALAT